MKKQIFLLAFSFIMNFVYPQTDIYKNDLKYINASFKIDPAKYFIQGDVRFKFVAVSPISEIVFDLTDGLTIDSILSGTRKLNFIYQNNFIKITPLHTISSGATDSVRIFYHGEPNSSDGSFVQSFHEGKPIIWTLSEPYGAKDWWPCKQTLNDKIDSIDIFIEIPKGNKAASNGILKEIIDNDTTFIYHWKHKHPIVTYLVALAVTNYVEYTDTFYFEDKRIPILNYVYPEYFGASKAATPSLLPAMELFSETFGLYPFADEKYGHAQCGFSGGMEHQTMTFLNKMDWGLMVHELAHQWFGDFVTCGSWQDIWLNESFATFCHTYAIEKLQTKSNEINRITELRKSALKETTESVFVYDTSSSSRIFDYSLSYAKGALVLRFLRNQIGDTAFYRAVRNYLYDTKTANAFALSQDIIRHFENEAQIDLEYFFQDWLYGVGYPQYNVNWWNWNGKIGITINQTSTSHDGNFFEARIPVKIFVGSTDSSIVLNHTFSGESFLIDLGYQADSIQFDPERVIPSSTVSLQTSIKEISQEFLIMNNPSRGFLRILVSDSFRAKKVEIRSISGSIVQGQVVDPNNLHIEIPISFINEGIYFVELVDIDGRRQRQKFVSIK